MEKGKSLKAEGIIITLCRRCHLKTNGNRGYWTKYFREIKHGQR